MTANALVVAVLGFGLPPNPLLDACPLFGRGSSSKSSATSSNKRPSVTSLLDDAEKQFLASAGIGTKPLVCQAAEAAVDTAIRSTVDELGSLSVDVNASSSAGLLLGGTLLSARVEAKAIAVAGLRASSLTLSSEDNVQFVVPDPFTATPPNLKGPTPLQFSVKLSSDDINSSPVIKAALQEILRELIRSGVSAAIGEILPRDRSGLVINLVRVEPPADGRLVLVADAEATQSDGTTIALSGMRVRTRPKANAGSDLIVLDKPELLSSFEGFGAKVELGLPFLRAAGVPLPPDVSIRNLRVDDGAILVEGSYLLKPIDYEALIAIASAAAQELQEASRSGEFSRTPPDAVAVDVEATAEPEEPPPSVGRLPAA